MIPLLFTFPLKDVKAIVTRDILAADITAVDVRRRMPNPRPHRIVVLRAEGSQRTAEVHKVVRVVATIWATFDDGTLDFDTIEQLGGIVQRALERAGREIRILTAIDSRGPFPVTAPDEPGVELRLVTVDYQTRGTSL